MTETSATRAPVLEAGGEVNGYRVLRRLGGASTLAEYEVESLAIGVRRVLRVFPPALAVDPAGRAAFERDAQVGTRVDSPHLVEVCDAGIDEATGAPFVVEVRMEGETLAERLSRGRPEVAVGAPWLIDVGKALAAAHAQGWAHGALSAESVVIARVRDGSERALLRGLGLTAIVARAREVNTQGVVIAIGDVQSLAPEQLSAKATLRPLTDVWAYGLLAYHALVGEPYFRGEAPMDILRQIMAEPILPPSQRAESAALPPGFDAWFAACVERQPNRRPPMAEAVQRLREVLEGYAARDAILRRRDRFIAESLGGAAYGRGEPTTCLSVGPQVCLSALENSRDLGPHVCLSVAGPGRWRGRGRRGARRWVLAIGLLVLAVSAAVTFLLLRAGR